MPKDLVSNYRPLMSLGLSKTAVACYESLFAHGGASVSELAEYLKQPRTGLYRVLKQLEAKGFVSNVRAASQPTYFFAQPLDVALGNYARYQRRQVEELLKEQNEILMKRAVKSVGLTKRSSFLVPWA